MAASYQVSTDARRRPTALLLAIVAHLLVIWLLFRLAPHTPDPPQRSSGPSTFRLMPSAEKESEATQQKAEVAKRKSAATAATRPLPRPPVPPVKVPRPESTPVPPWPDMIGGKDMFRSADIAKMPSRPEDQLAANAAKSGSGRSGDSSAATGPGDGPNGEQLYNADWLTEPTDSQISPYLPKSAPPTGWGMVACQTIPRNQVDNCRAIGESPVGSGYARTVRQAAWQFRVLPPRLGGRPIIGAWVRIRITFSENVIRDVK